MTQDAMTQDAMTKDNGKSAYRITTVEELRRVLLPPRPTTPAKLLDQLDAQAREFLAASPFLLLATAGADGRIEVSPKGDGPGFVLVEDPRTIVIPDRPGNNLAFGLQNILHNPKVGVIALLPATGEMLRCSGKAEISADPALLERLSARGKPALLAIRVRIDRAYFHCAKAILRSGLWDPQTWSAPRKISFGRIIVAQLGLEGGAVAEIDERVGKGYRTTL